MKTLSIAALFALLASPALAAPQDVAFPAREPVTIKVSTSGLDLSSPRDRERLHSRMNRAIEAACHPSDVYASYQTPDTQCFQEMAQAASSKLQAYAQNSDGSAVAKN